jgi:hypothetical protein
MTMHTGKLAAIGAAALGALAIGGAAPAVAGGGRISDRDVERARDACREIAHNRDWKVEDTHLRDKDDDRRRITILVQGNRRGQGDRERECVYDVRSGDAQFEDQD